MKSNTRFAAAVVVAATLATGAAFAVTPEQSKTISSTIQRTKVVELAARSAEFVTKAAKEDRSEVASIVVSTTAKRHPSALVSVLTSVLKQDASVAEAVTAAAVGVSPEKAEVIVATVASVVPDQAAKVSAVAAKLVPSRASAIEREGQVASTASKGSRSRQAVASAAVVTGGDIVQTGGNDVGKPNPQNLYAFPGFDPTRP